MKPGIEGRLAAKVLEPPIGMDKCILDRILGVSAIARIAHRELHHSVPIFTYERIEGAVLAGLSPSHEHSIARSHIQNHVQFRWHWRRPLCFHSFGLVADPGYITLTVMLRPLD